MQLSFLYLYLEFFVCCYWTISTLLASSWRMRSLSTWKWWDDSTLCNCDKEEWEWLETNENSWFGKFCVELIQYLNERKSRNLKYLEWVKFKLMTKRKKKYSWLFEKKIEVKTQKSGRCKDKTVQTKEGKGKCQKFSIHIFHLPFLVCYYWRQMFSKSQQQWAKTTEAHKQSLTFHL